MLKYFFHSASLPDIPTVIRRILVSWLFAVMVEYLLLPKQLQNLTTLDALAQMSLLRAAMRTVAVIILLCMVSRFINTVKLERWGLVLIFAVTAFTALRASFTLNFLAACLLILILLIIFAVRGLNQAENTNIRRFSKPSPAFLWVVSGLSGIFFLFVSCWTVGRFYSFCCPTFDFGIFSQMFYHMKESGLPMTTVERDGLLSHFNVHVSPVWYLLLPFYWIVSTPAMLQILQAAVITSAVIPLWKIGKHHGLTGAQQALLCGVLFLYPAYSGGTSYDIHENCFLTPFILWIFYGIDKKNHFILFSAAILTLSVKEDAAVYVAVIALWMLAKAGLQHGKNRRHDFASALVLLVLSFCWFFAVTGYLANIGDGVMTWRYRNFMYNDSSSLMTLIQSVFLNPMKVIFECTDNEKREFILLTLIPLLGLPFLTRRYERYILLIPYLLINLMPDYQYQHNIFFQYTFGSFAFLIYLSVINLADFGSFPKQTAVLILTVALNAVCFGKTVVPKAIRYPIQAVQSFDYYQTIRDILKTIPDDASVTATTFYTAYLSQREVLYDVRYSSKEHLLETQYVVLNTSAKSNYKNYESDEENSGLSNLLSLLEQNGYERYQSAGSLEIYRKKD